MPAPELTPRAETYHDAVRAFRPLIEAHGDPGGAFAGELDRLWYAMDRADVDSLLGGIDTTPEGAD